MMGRSLHFLSLLLFLFFSSPSLVEGIIYDQTEIWQGQDFFNHFTFYSDPDPTHGYVDYATEQEAIDWGLVNVNDKGQVLMQADSWSVTPQDSPGRGSVRIQSDETFSLSKDQYLFVLDLSHMPTGCGTWPAYWLLGPNWPAGGEVDVIEGVNVNTVNQVTIHTDDGCSMVNDSSSSFSGVLTNQDCAYQPGCGITPAGRYGSDLNSEGGGVYATEYNNTAISVWYFDKDNVPADLQEKSVEADPSKWGIPAAYYPFSSTYCPSSHFHDMQIIFDLTFCGDWAGSVFTTDCPGLGDCDSYVQNNPSAFTEAYWLINYLKIMSA